MLGFITMGQGRRETEARHCTLHHDQSTTAGCFRRPSPAPREPAPCPPPGQHPPRVQAPCLRSWHPRGPQGASHQPQRLHLRSARGPRAQPRALSLLLSSRRPKRSRQYSLPRQPALSLGGSQGKRCPGEQRGTAPPSQLHLGAWVSTLGAQPGTLEPSVSSL